MEVVLKAKHFKNADFTNPWDCPLSRATKELFPREEVRAGVGCTTVGDKIFYHGRYDHTHFLKDRRKTAGIFNWLFPVNPDKVIRTIEFK